LIQWGEGLIYCWGLLIEVLYLSSTFIFQQLFCRKNWNDQNSGIAHLVALFKSYKTVCFRKPEKYGYTRKTPSHIVFGVQVFLGFPQFFTNSEPFFIEKLETISKLISNSEWALQIQSGCTRKKISFKTRCLQFSPVSFYFHCILEVEALLSSK
jgi:hypothetical protein